MEKKCLKIGAFIVIFLVIMSSVNASKNSGKGFNSQCVENKDYQLLVDSLTFLEGIVNVQWAKVETIYQRRVDLIPNLVYIVKRYTKHEEKTLTEVKEACDKATQTIIDSKKLTEENIAAFQMVQDELSYALIRLLVCIEQYPDLKANQNFLDFQAQLEGTENRIAVERHKYNEKAQAFNMAIRSFPENVVTGFGGFQQKGYFKEAKGNDKAPTI